MESDELHIYNRCGKRQPFTVPTGYFGSFSERLSTRLPSCEAAVAVVPFWRRHRIAVAVAAFLCLAVGGAVSFFTYGSSESEYVANQSELQNSSTDNSIDCVADYTMIDNEDIYALVSNNQ